MHADAKAFMRLVHILLHDGCTSLRELLLTVWRKPQRSPCMVLAYASTILLRTVCLGLHNPTICCLLTNAIHAVGKLQNGPNPRDCMSMGMHSHHLDI